ncbi:MAG: DNA-directed RNA polymerase subunit E'' [Candidatus Bathyarchaeota archaeon]|nr:DNA-directed RNA polymerase subunit E'' [Candidatus Bathyarchaeota archaeon]
MRACRSCKNISDETVCPVCKGTEFSEDYSGLLVVLDPENSILAEKLDTTEEGQYALKIR